MEQHIKFETLNKYHATYRLILNWLPGFPGEVAVLRGCTRGTACGGTWPEYWTRAGPELRVLVARPSCSEVFWL